MRAKEYDLLVKCVEDGVSYGYSRAHKHTDTPDPMQLQSQIIQAVMNEICEWFEFRGDGYESEGSRLDT